MSPNMPLQKTKILKQEPAAPSTADLEFYELFDSSFADGWKHYVVFRSVPMKPAGSRKLAAVVWTCSAVFDVRLRIAVFFLLCNIDSAVGSSHGLWRHGLVWSPFAGNSWLISQKSKPWKTCISFRDSSSSARAHLKDEPPVSRSVRRWTDVETSKLGSTGVQVLCWCCVGWFCFRSVLVVHSDCLTALDVD